MARQFLKLIVLVCWSQAVLAGSQPSAVEKWDIFEVALSGPETGNPFIGVVLQGIFRQGQREFRVDGFYDGGGVYRIRFMPDSEGLWEYETVSNRRELHGHRGQFLCTPPSPGNHGPVRVRNRFHFAYADGTPFYPFGTTCYGWLFEPESLRLQTLSTLAHSPFNKVRFLVLPAYSEDYLRGPRRLDHFPFEGTPPDGWDFSRFDPEFFRRIEWGVSRLRDLGIEADLILFRPYDHGRFGFDTMDDETNQRFIRYVVARLAAYRNVWWCLANEQSFIRHLREEDWDRYFQLLAARDPYGHLRSIHNADQLYDYRKPWVTHVALQYYNVCRSFGAAALVRDIYGKPIVNDEINYEGNISRRWGQLSGEEMVYRFWLAYIGGTYASHGETIDTGTGIEWTSEGGSLHGQSPPRIAFLRQIVESGPQEGLEPLDHYYVMNLAGKYGEYYLLYFGKEPVREWEFRLPDDGLEDGMRFRVEIIDTWNMTIRPVKGEFIVQRADSYTFRAVNRPRVKLPGRPYMALRIRRVHGGP
ncbi:MAG: DUF5605 domain-containing protein [candidate division KSB1 bacterium]|nr:DUF5605 domain-containing protein [candidate division KSB1 bacterium]